MRAEPGLDLYRGFAVLLMIMVHVRRVQRLPAAESGVGAVVDRLFRFCMWAEPYIAASFLFMVGMSLVLARRARQSEFYPRLLRRALLLYLLSLGLFVLQFGLALPDLLASSGVLSAIAVALIVVGAALGSSRPHFACAALMACVLALTALLDHFGLSVSGLNGGPGGTCPLVAFAAFGAISASLYAERGPGGLVAVSVASVLPTAVALASGRSFITTQVSQYTSYGDGVAILGLLRGAPASQVPVPFWNHSALGALGLALPLAFSALVIVGWLKNAGSAAPARPFVIVGRHALSVYVGHLCVLGLLEGAGLVPASAIGALLVVLGLMALGAAYGVAKERVFQNASVAR